MRYSRPGSNRRLAPFNVPGARGEGQSTRNRCIPSLARRLEKSYYALQDAHEGGCVSISNGSLPWPIERHPLLSPPTYSRRSWGPVGHQRRLAIAAWKACTGSRDFTPIGSLPEQQNPSCVRTFSLYAHIMARGALCTGPKYVVFAAFFGYQHPLCTK